MTRNRGKAVLVILDGLGDLPVEALGGLTPLEAARTPNLDGLASGGRFGLVDPITAGVVPNTDSAVGLLLGLPLAQTGCLNRGPVEAAGTGRLLEPGEVAARANFATVERRRGRLFVTDRRAGRITSNTEELARALQDVDLGDGVRAEFRPTDQHRGVLILSGPGLHPEISDTDPGDRHAPGYLSECLALQPAAEMTAAKVSRFVELAHRRLGSHPVNEARVRAGRPPATGIITRGAGAWFDADNTVARRGVKAALVAGCNTVLGLARMFGLDTVEEPGFTAGLDTDFEGKVAACLRALSDYDLVFVHIKAPDLCAHDRLAAAKRDVLERVDEALGPLATAGAIVAVTSDHTTDSNVGAHTADPVPSLIFTPSAAPKAAGKIIKFGETACRAGNLERRRSHDFLDAVLTGIGY